MDQKRKYKSSNLAHNRKQFQKSCTQQASTSPQGPHMVKKNVVSQRIVLQAAPEPKHLDADLVDFKEEVGLIDTAIAKCLTKVTQEKLDLVIGKVIRKTLKTDQIITTALKKTKEVQIKKKEVKEELTIKYTKKVKCNVCQKIFSSSHGLGRIHNREHCNVTGQKIKKPDEVKQCLKIDTKPLNSNENPELTEYKTIEIDAKPLNCNIKLLVIEHKTEKVDTKPLNSNEEIAVKEYKTVEIETKPLTGDIKPEVIQYTIELKPEVDDVVEDAGDNSHLNETIIAENITVPGVFKCQICNKYFKRPKFFEKHLAGHKKDNEKCVSCQNSVKKCTCEVSRQFKCDKCEKSFQHSGSLKKHIKYCPSLLNTSVYECETCHNTYKSRSVLTRHKLIHSEDKYHRCEVCGRKFAQALALKRHSYIHILDKPLTCDICFKRFGYPQALKRHVLTHSETKPVNSVKKDRPTIARKSCYYSRENTTKKSFQCHQCGKSYSKLSFLKTHILAHKGIKPFECDYCHKKFSERSGLRAHIQRHAGFKRYTDTYKCTFCGKEFAHPSALGTHVRTHTGNQPFKCEICNKRFAFRSLLLVHNKSHSRDKPITCDLCNKSFKHTSQLNKHVKSNHNLKRECNIVIST